MMGEVVAASRSTLGALEPPVTESIVAALYRLMGREELLLARTLTTLFWMIAGVFLVMAVSRLVAPPAALVSLAYFLFVPVGILISLSFIPDSLMLLLFCAGVFLTIRYLEGPSVVRLLLAALVCAGAILAKPMSVFALTAAF